MIFLFLILHIISFLAALLLRKWRGTRQKEIQVLSQRVIKEAIALIGVVFVYILVTYLFKIYLRGPYTDFIAGVLVFAYLDYQILCTAPNSRQWFVKLYLLGRKSYALYNFLRIVAFVLCAIFF